MVNGILADVHPLPTTARADTAYVEVAALLCDSLAPGDWGDARVLEPLLLAGAESPGAQQAERAFRLLRYIALPSD